MFPLYLSSPLMQIKIQSLSRYSFIFTLIQFFKKKKCNCLIYLRFALPRCAALRFSVVSDPCDPVGCSPPGCSVHGILQARRLEWLPRPSPGIFPTQGSNPGLLRCKWILYRLSHFGLSPK